MDAVPELDERMAVEPDERDVAADGLVDEGLRRRPERLALGEPDEPLELGREVEEDRRVVGGDEVVDERDGHPPGLEPDGLLAVLVDAVVLAVLAGGPGLAVADVGAGEVLELERDVLGDVADPRPVAQPRDEPAAPAERAGVVLEGRHERDERVGEAGELVGRVVLEDAEVDEQADDRFARPVVRAAQDARLEDAQGRQRSARRPVGGRLRGAASSPRWSVRRSRSPWSPGASCAVCLVASVGRSTLARGRLAAGQGVEGRRRDPLAGDAGRSDSRPAASAARRR